MRRLLNWLLRRPVYGPAFDYDLRLRSASETVWLNMRFYDGKDGRRTRGALRR